MTTIMTDIKRKRKLWYFDLEPLKERYTYQLSNEWTPESYKDYDVDFIQLDGRADDNEIKVGSVLDACGRGIYAMNQCQIMLKAIANGEVQNNDIILLQDFWTPGIESVFYALDLYDIDCKVYSMLHAQSVDEYDFTYAMRHWIRFFELGIDSRHAGIFVGSTIHKEQLREAGFKAPIHVVSLPIHKELAMQVAEGKDKPKENKVIFTSRYDKEKNPFFMLKVAEEFLNHNLHWEWVVTTSGSEFRSSIPGFVDFMKKFAENNPRFKMLSELTKEQYYHELQTAKIQFNSSLQDYVSWTLIESTMFDCDIVYPNFRSFPEIIDEYRLYKPFSVQSALSKLEACKLVPRTHQHISDISDKGRRLEAHIIMNDIKQEFNIWHESEYFKKLENKQI